MEANTFVKAIDKVLDKAIKGDNNKKTKTARENKLPIVLEPEEAQKLLR